MKKILALLLALCMVFALAACGQESDTTTEPPAGTDNVETEAPESDTPEAEPVEVIVFAAASMEAFLKANL